MKGWVCHIRPSLFISSRSWTSCRSDELTILSDARALSIPNIFSRRFFSLSSLTSRSLASLWASFACSSARMDRISRLFLSLIPSIIRKASSLGTCGYIAVAAVWLKFSSLWLLLLPDVRLRFARLRYSDLTKCAFDSPIDTASLFVILNVLPIFMPPPCIIV